jgi:hypothetical protein
LALAARTAGERACSGRDRHPGAGNQPIITGAEWKISQFLERLPQ